MKLITLSDGQQTQVSDEDFIFLSGFSWHFNFGYAFTTIANKEIPLHRLVAKRMGLDCSNLTDHIDRNPLNNQHFNLRAATRSQNGVNSKLSKNNTSGITGVTWDKQYQKWRAQIMINGKNKYLGIYINKEQAIFARGIAAKKYFKEFACED